MNEKKRILKIIELLKEMYPDAECSLSYESPYELLFATRLSAQCTDARVNIITKELYKKYTSLKAFADSDINELMSIIYSCGFYRVKANDIRETARLLIEKHDGRVPNTMDELLALPGVGRKTANLILGDLYGKPAIVADTHCIRLSNRLGLVSVKDPQKVEFGLKKIIPPDEQCGLCHRFVYHGRALCTARSPKCDECPLRELCKHAQKKGSDNNVG